MSEDLMAAAVEELARSLEFVLVLLRDSKKLDPNDYRQTMAGVDRARELARKATTG